MIRLGKLNMRYVGKIVREQICYPQILNVRDGQDTVNITRRRLVLFAAVSMVGVGCPSAVYAQYPEREIRLIVPSVPGGFSDTLYRILAKYLENELGRPVVVYIKPGAGGRVGLDYLRSRRSDGYTLSMFASKGGSRGPFNLEKISPVAMFAKRDYVLLSRIGSFISLKAFRDKARASPGEFRVGARSIQARHAARLINSVLGIQTKIVRPRSSGVMAVLAAQTDLVITPMHPNILKNPRLQVLTVLTTKRPAYPKDTPRLPIAGEQGFELAASIRYGLVAPKGIPSDVRQVLQDAVKKNCSFSAIQRGNI